MDGIDTAEDDDWPEMRLVDDPYSASLDQEPRAIQDAPQNESAVRGANESPQASDKDNDSQRLEEAAYLEMQEQEIQTTMALQEQENLQWAIVHSLPDQGIVT